MACYAPGVACKRNRIAYTWGVILWYNTRRKGEATVDRLVACKSTVARAAETDRVSVRFTKLLYHKMHVFWLHLWHTPAGVTARRSQLAVGWWALFCTRTSRKPARGAGFDKDQNV